MATPRYKQTYCGKEKTVVAVEAGEVGWQLIEKRELAASLAEFLEGTQVMRVVIDPQLSYLTQVNRILMSSSITHWVMDFRTSSISLFRLFFQTIGMMRLLQLHKVCPIVHIADLPVFKWRLCGALVTKRGGVIWTQMAQSHVFKVMGRVPAVGPQIMPFSSESAKSLTLIDREEGVPNRMSDGGFFGQLYHSRLQELLKIKSEFELLGLSFTIKGQQKIPLNATQKVADSPYWRELRKYRILVTTACHLDSKFGLFVWPPHFVLRYTEALLSGQFLLAPYIDGIKKYFIPYEHFVPYDNPRDAADKAQDYLNRPTDLDSISGAGRARVMELIRKQVFWNEIELELSRSGLPSLLREDKPQRT